MPEETDTGEEKKHKYIIVIGSLMSGLGKGIVTSSIGRSLKARGFKVVPIKFDGYLNVDCGTMNPYRHGEVFVLDDGTECDMDFGTYERFLNVDLNSINSLTGGKIFKLVIEKERKGGYLGYDVQIVPHLTNEIKKLIKKVGNDFDADVVMVEVGGTAGDIENSYFIEAMRQFAFEEKDVAFIQLTYVPVLTGSGEQKTKPTQHATKLLLSMGIQPDFIVCRETEKLNTETKKKMSMFCNVPIDSIIDDPDLKTIYELPEIFEKQHLSELLIKRLHLSSSETDLKGWTALVERIKNPKHSAVIGITGKYTALRDAYVSIKEALVHAGAHTDCNVEVKWIETTEIEEGKRTLDVLNDCDGIIVPGGFGARGTEGKISCIRWARENKIPYLGLCFGMQLAVVEWARNMCRMEGANSTEIDQNTKYPVIDLLPEQRHVEDKGATMRLGSYPCKLKKGTRAHAAYGADLIHERHRHRYEFNDDFRQKLEEGGLVIGGVSPDEKIVEMIEWPDGWGVGTQAHPELKSRLERPAPLFLAFMREVLKRKK